MLEYSARAIVIKPPFPRIKTFLLGKTASYRLNAYDDAEIAAEIISFIKTGKMPQGTNPIQQRAASFITHTPDDAHKRERLAVQAYTLYHLNGYADLMWSRFIERLGGLEAPCRRDGYGDYETCPIDLWFWVAPLLRKDVSMVQAYARDVAGIELTLTYSEMVREVVRVQEANIAANHRTCQLLREMARSEHPKVDTLCELASKVAHSKIFLGSAAQTQIAAGNWDRLVVWYLRRHFAPETV